MSRDLSNGSLKTGRQRAENLHSNLFKRREGEREKEQEQRSEQQVSEDRRGDRVQRTYIGIYIRKTSLKRDGETLRGELTYGSLERERGKERKRARAAQRFDQWVSEDRQGNKRVENLHRDR